MALAPKTVLTYPLDGANRDFTIPFEYLARKFVQVTLVGKDRTILTLNIDYRFTQRTIITTTKPWGPADGYERIEIRRYTSATERLVDFSDGSILRAYDLNTSQVQSLHIAEEGRDVASDTIGVNNDGDLDARGRKIVNLADAVSDGDAVTLRQEKAWSNSALSQANRSEQMASAAHGSRIAADDAARRANGSAVASYRDAERAKRWAEEVSGVEIEPGQWSSKAWALTSGQYAGQSQAAQAASQTSAERSNTSAVASYQDANRSTAAADRSAAAAGQALAQANRAEAEANKLGNANAFMETIWSVEPSKKVIFKGPQHIVANLFVQQYGTELADSKYGYMGYYGGGLMVLGNSQGGDLIKITVDGTMSAKGGFESGGVLKTTSGIVTSVAAGTSHFVLQGTNGVNRGMVFSGDDRIVRLGAADGAVHFAVHPNGRSVLPGPVDFKGSSSYIPTDCNLVSSIFHGGNLREHLARLELASTVYRDERVVLWQGTPWGIGATIVLNSDVRNFQSFASHWNSVLTGTVCTLTGLRELTTFPFGTVMYMGTDNGVYYQVKFNDLGDGTYRSITMVGAGTGATALPVIYGFRRKV
ncbi:tail fiber protein [Pseudomonas phage 22PfluR64PP]|uniref:Tail fiber protein n=1 Tax=Pseudomonas phage 22PfluR64PP TaxID=2163970 RepID=A0A2S1PDH2_9CAUD|nr:tail fiber protein [Pseudomonas phage 22PfluR64PP]AWH14588.1 tail fiber protein [Pseudomonas phage 22PfluR64PP]